MLGLEDAERVLGAYWGFTSFRKAQRRVIAAAIRGRDVLALLPTGAGKSLCYQVPAVLGSGLTIVVSPLVALMQDQVAALREKGVCAVMVNATQSPAERDASLALVRSGAARLLYVAPERMRSLAALLRPGSVSRLVVDEAHCVSEWGHDFRPNTERWVTTACCWVGRR